MPGKSKSKHQLRSSPKYDNRKKNKKYKRTRKSNNPDNFQDRKIKGKGKGHSRPVRFTDFGCGLIYGACMASAASAASATENNAYQKVEILPVGWKIIYYKDENGLDLKGYINLRKPSIYTLSGEEKSGDTYVFEVDGRKWRGIIPWHIDEIDENTNEELIAGKTFKYHIPQSTPPVVKHGARHCYQPDITSYTAAGINRLIHNIHGTKGEDLQNCGEFEKSLEVSDTTSYLISGGVLAGLAAAVVIIGSGAVVGGTGTLLSEIAPAAVTDMVAVGLPETFAVGVAGMTSTVLHQVGAYSIKPIHMLDENAAVAAQRLAFESENALIMADRLTSYSSSIRDTSRSILRVKEHQPVFPSLVRTTTEQSLKIARDNKFKQTARPKSSIDWNREWRQFDDTSTAREGAKGVSFSETLQMTQDIPSLNTIQEMAHDSISQQGVMEDSFGQRLPRDSDPVRRGTSFLRNS